MREEEKREEDMSGIVPDFRETLDRISEATAAGKEFGFLIAGLAYDFKTDSMVGAEFRFSRYTCHSLQYMGSPCNALGVSINFVDEKQTMTFTWEFVNEDTGLCLFPLTCDCAKEVTNAFNGRFLPGKGLLREDSVEAVERGRKISKKWKERKGPNTFRVTFMKREWLREEKLMTDDKRPKYGPWNKIILKKFEIK